ncbi:MAG: STAS domain-containing protein [Thermoleophilia bacterium]
MQVVLEDLGGQPLLQVSGEVDHSSSPRLFQAVDEALRDDATHILLINLAGCPYLDSGGVRVLLEGLRRVKPAGWMGVIAPDPQVFRILKMVGLTIDPHFRTFVDVDDARTALEELEHVEGRC